MLYNKSGRFLCRKENVIFLEMDFGFGCFLLVVVCLFVSSKLKQQLI